MSLISTIASIWFMHCQFGIFHHFTDFGCETCTVSIIFFKQTRGWPFFPAAFSERKRSRSLKENLPFTKCLTVRQKDPDDLVFAPHVVVTSNPSPPILFKSNDLDGVMESSFLLLSKFKIFESQCAVWNVILGAKRWHQYTLPASAQCHLDADIWHHVI